MTVHSSKDTQLDMLPELPDLPKKADFKDEMLHCIVKLLTNLLKQNDRQTMSSESEIIKGMSELQAGKIVKAYGGKPDAYTRDMMEWRQLHQHFAQDADLWRVLMPKEPDDNNPYQLIQLISRLAQWDTVMQIWQTLAERCKAKKRAATAQEIGCLKYALSIHNLIYNDKKAQLKDVEVGTAYHFNTMQRGNSTGETIKTQWLPALHNAAGQVVCKPLVETM